MPLKPQDRLAVRPEPLVVMRRDQLIGQHFGETERLKQTHDLVIDMDRAREAVNLLIALEHPNAMTRSSQQRRERLPHRAVPDDRHVEIAASRRLRKLCTHLSTGLSSLPPGFPESAKLYAVRRGVSSDKSVSLV